MSWGASLKPTPAAEFAAAVDAMETPSAPTETQEETAAQFEAAKAAAKAIMASGAIGTLGEYTVSMTGHAEPDHIRRDGYSADMLYVQVARYAKY